MVSKKGLLRKSRLYIIADKATCGDVIKLFKKINTAKVKVPFVLQLRDKRIGSARQILRDARRLKALSGKNSVFIINDYPDIAVLAGADGVHLGQKDLPVKIARKLLGKDKIIGVSCHSLAQAIQAQKQGADYVGIGPIFPTPTKPEDKSIGTSLLKKLNKKLRIPFFAIGGVDESNLDKICATGAKRVAVCRAICKDINIPAAFIRIINKLEQ